MDVDAVLVLTSGSHAPIAIAAAEAGKHVLVEKPMCFSVAEGQAMIAAAERAKVTLMVAYNKRYDPAYLRLQEQAKDLRDLRLVRITTLESPFQPYVAHYRLHKAEPPPARDETARITAAIGDADPLSRRAYHLVLLDSMVHEFNAIRGVLGEPDRLEFADITRTRPDRHSALRRHAVHRHLGRSAWHGALSDGVRVLRAGPAPDAVVSVAVPAQRADGADDRGRRGRRSARVANRGGRVLRRKLQAGTAAFP